MGLAPSKWEFCLELFDGGGVPVPISPQPRSDEARSERFACLSNNLSKEGHNGCRKSFIDSSFDIRSG
jgi:hypothetical protein